MHRAGTYNYWLKIGVTFLVRKRLELRIILLIDNVDNDIVFKLIFLFDRKPGENTFI